MRRLHETRLKIRSELEAPPALRKFGSGWISSMLVQVLTWLSFMPAQTVFKLTAWTEFRAWVAALPFLIQLIAIMFLTDELIAKPLKTNAV